MIFFLDSGLLRMDFSMRVFVFSLWGLLVFFNESLCFFGLRPIENWFFNESVCFLVSGLLKIDFLMKVFAFLVSGIVEDGAVHFFSWICRLLRPELLFKWVFVFLVSGLLKTDFSMSVCFFGLRHCGRRCGPLFSYEFVEFLKTELFLNESLCFFGLRHIENWFSSCWQYLGFGGCFFLLRIIIKK